MDDQQRIIDAIHDHDRRLVKVETELHGLHGQVIGLATHIEKLAEYVSELRGSHKWVFWIVTIGVPAILALELWERLFR